MNEQSTEDKQRVLKMYLERLNADLWNYSKYIEWLKAEIEKTEKELKSE